MNNDGTRHITNGRNSILTVTVMPSDNGTVSFTCSRKLMLSTGINTTYYNDTYLVTVKGKSKIISIYYYTVNFT